MKRLLHLDRPRQAGFSPRRRRGGPTSRGFDCRCRSAAPRLHRFRPTSRSLTGYIDLGYRWVTGVYGSFDTYRSVVDLGSGPKLLGTEFTILNTFLPGKRFFDRIDVRAYNWGDDPYATLHLDISKAKLYDFSADYRNIAYYNNLPAFADPLLGSGMILNEQSHDTHKRIGDFRLDLLPSRVIHALSRIRSQLGYRNRRRDLRCRRE